MKLFIVLLAVVAIKAEPEAHHVFGVNHAVISPYSMVKPSVVNPYVYSNPMGYPFVQKYMTPTLVKQPVVTYTQPMVELKKSEGLVEKVDEVSKFDDVKKVEDVMSYKTVPYVTPYAQPLVYASHIQHPVKYDAVSAGVRHTVTKREADAHHIVNPYFGGYAASTYGHAYPAATYSHAYPAISTYAGAYPAISSYASYPYSLTNKAASYKNDFINPFTNYAGKGTYVANSGGAVHVAKREAEAHHQLAYAFPTAMSYAKFPTTTYSHAYPAYSTFATGHIAQPLSYAPTVPVSYMHPQVVPAKTISYKNAVADHPTTDYAAKGTYVANSGGAIHVAKREAEAQYYPHTYGTYPSTYAGVYPTNTYSSVYPTNTYSSVYPSVSSYMPHYYGNYKGLYHY